MSIDVPILTLNGNNFLINYFLRKLFTVAIRARFLQRKWSCISRTLGDDILSARCLMLNSYLIDRYFSVDLTTNIGDVKLSTNEVYGRNDLWKLVGQSLNDPTLSPSLDPLSLWITVKYFTRVLLDSRSLLLYIFASS